MPGNPARHEEPTAAPWCNDAAADGIARVANDAVGRFDPDALWPTHPMDESEDADPYGMLHFGAAGIIYAVRRNCRLFQFVPHSEPFACAQDKLREKAGSQRNQTIANSRFLASK